jgi:hypothetical protein
MATIEVSGPTEGNGGTVKIDCGGGTLLRPVDRSP